MKHFKIATGAVLFFSDVLFFPMPFNFFSRSELPTTTLETIVRNSTFVQSALFILTLKTKRKADPDAGQLKALRHKSGHLQTVTPIPPSPRVWSVPVHSSPIRHISFTWISSVSNPKLLGVSTLFPQFSSLFMIFPLKVCIINSVDVYDANTTDTLICVPHLPFNSIFYVFCFSGVDWQSVLTIYDNKHHVKVTQNGGKTETMLSKQVFSYWTSYLHHGYGLGGSMWFRR